MSFAKTGEIKLNQVNPRLNGVMIDTGVQLGTGGMSEVYAARLTERSEVDFTHAAKIMTTESIPLENLNAELGLKLTEQTLPDFELVSYLFLETEIDKSELFSFAVDIFFRSESSLSIMRSVREAIAAIEGYNYIAAENPELEDRLLRAEQVRFIASKGLNDELLATPVLIFPRLARHYSVEQVNFAATNTEQQPKTQSEKIEQITNLLCEFTAIAKVLSVHGEKGIVHRDIKPQNLLISADNGKMRLIDWGMAFYEKYKNIENTAGTIDYMPPEQLPDSTTPISAKTDQYALMLTIAESIATIASDGEITKPFKRNLFKENAILTVHDLIGESYVVNTEIIKTLLVGIDHRNSGINELVNDFAYMLEQYLGVDEKIAREIDRIIRTALEVRPEDRHQDLFLAVASLKEIFRKISHRGGTPSAKLYQPLIDITNQITEIDIALPDDDVYDFRSALTEVDIASKLAS